jgi:hypothetical protein
MADEKPFQLPGSSWETIKKIIRAFHAAQGQVNPTVASIAKLAGVPRPVVSVNNNFLRSIALLQSDQWKLTELGTRLATGMGLGNQSLVRDALQEVVRGNETLRQLVGILQARSPMKTDRFRAEAVLLFGLNEKSRQLPFVKAVLDLLQDSQAVQISEDEVAFRGYYGGEIKGEAHRPASVQRFPRLGSSEEARANNKESGEGTRMPVPLGPGRLAYLELPPDWKREELPKLIKLLQISLGDDLELDKERG